MIRFTLVTGKIYEVSTEEWQKLSKYLKDIAQIVVEDDSCYCHHISRRL